LPPWAVLENTTDVENERHGTSCQDSDTGPYISFRGCFPGPCANRQILSWQDDLAYLQNAPGDALAQAQAAVVQIRNGVELWLKMRPDAQIELASRPATAMGRGGNTQRGFALREAVESILKEDPAGRSTSHDDRQRDSGSLASIPGVRQH